MKKIYRKTKVFVVLCLFIGAGVLSITATEDKQVSKLINKSNIDINIFYWYEGWYFYFGKVQDYSINPTNISFNFTGLYIRWIQPFFDSTNNYQPSPMSGLRIKWYNNQGLHWDKPLVTSYGKINPPFICCIFFA